ncbi:MAG TPA: SUMF1/EgtB/PvdO family nonheme iron enzyme [Polyangiaceae bacterium]|nr:SUMF1/EgtB/PvdO family nonheme iron enzyme [Polyangiaceae bacterium]
MSHATFLNRALSCAVALWPLTCAVPDLVVYDSTSGAESVDGLLVHSVLDPVSIPEHGSGLLVPGVAAVSPVPECNASLASVLDNKMAQVSPREDDSEGCPTGMLEVSGLYCSSLLHRCVKGGRTHLGEVSDEPEPYYCEAFQVGRAICLGREERKHFCIDEFEYPNQRGALPTVMVNWYEARQLCQRQNKRLCGDDEWSLACEGPERLPYPYGWERDSSACNIDKRWIKPNDEILANKDAPPEKIAAEIERLSQRAASGAFPRCRSPYGVMDMGGNVDEWATNVTLRGKPYRSTFKGGHWMEGARNRCRPVTATHDETTAYYAEGFRCCADPA